MEAEKHPAWKQAVEDIVKLFEAKGYNITFSEDVILEMLKLEKPKYGTYDEFKIFQLERLGQLENLRTALLEENNLCLATVKGNGFVLIHPDDQVTIEAKKDFDASRRKLKRGFAKLTYVDSTALSDAAKEAQNKMLGRAAFIRMAMNKRKMITV